MIIGFQNCGDEEIQYLIIPHSIEETKHSDLLEISVSMNGEIQDSFSSWKTRWV